MNSTIRQILGRQKVSRWLTPALVFGVVYVIVRWLTASPVVVDPMVPFLSLDDDEIVKHVDLMPDARASECRSAVYDTKNVKVSIILDFHETQFYDLKLTLESIVKHTPLDLYEEIILLDDGTGQSSILSEASRFLSAPKFHRVKAFRSEQSHGTALSRFKASKVATGDFLVFVHCQVMLNAGWLPPLIDLISQDHHAVAVPHFDSLIPGGQYSRTNDALVHVFDWTLKTLYMDTRFQGKYIPTPVMTGQVYAINREFLDSIGNYDEGMGKGGGEDLELSLRIWLCGGSIKSIPCSRVASRNAMVPHEISEPKNFRRIVDQWLSEDRYLIYKQSGVVQYGDDSETESLKLRRHFLKKKTTCRPTKNYLNEIAMYLVRPSANSLLFGKLMSATGFCLDGSAATGDALSMTTCHIHMYQKTMLFELSRNGFLSHEDRCLTLMNNKGVSLEACANSQNLQKWVLNKEGIIRSHAEMNICLAHHSVASQSNSVASESKHSLVTLACPNQSENIPVDPSMQWSFIIH